MKSLKSIYKDIHDDNSIFIQHRYEGISQDISEYQRHEEKKLKISRGIYPWSLKLHKGGRELHAWNTLMRRRKLKVYILKNLYISS